MKRADRRVELYEWQRPLADKMVKALADGRVCVCGATTGAGKTYLALDVIRRLNIATLVVCPKAAIFQWRHAAREFGCEDLLLDVLNPQKISKRTGCAFYTREAGWKLPGDALVVFDEYQRYATGNSIGHEMPITARAVKRLRDVAGAKMMVLTATLADTPLKMEALGYWMDWNDGHYTFVSWCLHHGCGWQKYGWDSYSLEPIPWLIPDAMARIRKDMGERYVSIAPDQIPDFPDEVREVVYVDLDAHDHAALVKAYEDMPPACREMSHDDRVRQLRARQRAEFCKAKALADLAVDLEADGLSVFIVVNFTDTRMRIEETLRQKGISFVSVHGNQSDDARERAIAAFQRNDVHILIATAQAGGVALSLHDVHHERPRVSLISPGYSAADFMQSLGRIRRVGGTSVVQKIVIAARSVEEHVGRRLEWKLHNLAEFGKRIDDADFTRE